MKRFIFISIIFCFLSIGLFSQSKSEDFEKMFIGKWVGISATFTIEKGNSGLVVTVSKSMNMTMGTFPGYVNDFGILIFLTGNNYTYCSIDKDGNLVTNFLLGKIKKE
jgi:hypothetical protein